MALLSVAAAVPLGGNEAVAGETPPALPRAAPANPWAPSLAGTAAPDSQHVTLGAPRLPLDPAQGVEARVRVAIAGMNTVSRQGLPSSTAAHDRSVVFRKEAAEEIRLAQAASTIHVFGYRDTDERRVPPRTLEARFASALDAGSPELAVGQSTRHGCLYVGAFGFSCADPISSLLVNLKWHLR